MGLIYFRSNLFRTEKDLKIRTKKFAVDVLNFVDKLPNKRSANIIGNQLGRSASSVAANYRSACLAGSHAEFISKIAVAEEEADQSTFWLDIIPGTRNSLAETILPLLNEARELTAIFTASNKTAKKNKVSQKEEISQFPNPKISK
ncbi:MAG: four helix bundle protein [Bacteroidota bacterium]|nr:four helix bundle protein [Bacteroidota bacterium]